MTIISADKNEKGFYSIEQHDWINDLSQIPAGFIKVPDELHQKVWACVGCCDLVIEDGELTDIVPKEIPVDLDAVKSSAIIQTKAWVDATLAKGMVYADPLTQSAQTYNVTREKRADLAGVILVGKMAEEQGVPDDENILRWNVSGEVHEDWLYKDLCALAYAMYMYVTPIIEKQQNAEVKINEAVTADEITEILKDFD